MRFADFVPVLVVVANVCCRGAGVRGRRRGTVPIEDVYPRYGGGPSGIMVHPENLGPVRGYAIDPFAWPNTRRNHYKRRRPGKKIAFLVLHVTESLRSESTVKQFTRNSLNRQTSAHYVIMKPNEAGEHKRLLRMVPESFTAYHAGKSKWGKYSDLNPISIGIEIVNAGYYKNKWDPFPDEQIHIVGQILARMVKQYKILPHHVVGHADIAPYRKYDPGVMFPWARLHKKYGVGAWLEDDEMDEQMIMFLYKPKKRLPRAFNRQLFVKYLRAYGYDTADESSAIKAFKAHYSGNQNPHMYNEDVSHVEMYWIWALVAKYVRD